MNNLGARLYGGIICSATLYGMYQGFKKETDNYFTRCYNILSFGSVKGFIAATFPVSIPLLSCLEKIKSTRNKCVTHSEHP
uniref:Uncharacterized protein n=1 Tax=viral metagenome TaxID=1070528 RepID=A0A6C0EJK1_9ZZZZ